MKRVQIRFATEDSRPRISTPNRNSKRLSKRPRAWAAASPSMPPENRELCLPRRRALPPIDHADQLSDETMRLMKEKQIFAVPTFTIFEYFAEHAATPEQSAREHQMLDIKVQEFKKQITAGVPMAVGSDVGPFPHGTQAREFVLMVKYGMSPLAVLQADLLNGAKLLGWDGQIGTLEPGYFADVIAVPGDPRRTSACSRTSAS